MKPNCLIQVFVGHLRPIMLALLELHCQITFGVSHLKQNVEQLVSKSLHFISDFVMLFS